MKNQHAYELAGIIIDALAQWCERIEVAGSIRRGLENVNDIDLVILPKVGRRQEIVGRILQRCQPVTEGEQNVIAVLPLNRSKHEVYGVKEVQLDVFFAAHPAKDLFGVTPGTWGTMLLCRTGSAGHNVRLASRAKALGLHWNPYRGVLRGDQVIAAETEEDVFRALDLPWIPPGFREGQVVWDEFRHAPAEVTRSPGRRPDDAQASKLFDQMRQRIAQRAAEAVANGVPEAVARAAMKGCGA